jgi:DNA mismatch repair ATPase MutS
LKTFKHYINEIGGLRFIYDNLKLNSGIGRTKLLNSELLNREFELKRAFDALAETVEFISNKKNKDCLDKLAHHLYEINDIYSSIKNLTTSHIADDIELFEIKKFSLISQKISELLESNGYFQIMLRDLTEVIDILDPEKSRIPSFYIYSAYNEDLKNIRKLKDEATDSETIEKLRLQCIEIEDKVRKVVARSLTKFATNLNYNINQIAQLDILFAKATFAVEHGCCKPVISQSKTEYSAIFNPQIKEVLKSRGKDFQPVDICITSQPLLITGANMSGKTVLLKTIALSQYLFQFGFYVPAAKAEIKPVEEILISVGDNQNDLNGLSSFAVEMLNINRIISEAISGKTILALVDELARTTNPDEGIALVSAFVQMMSDLKVSSLVTTHYSGVKTNCSRLRVKGLKNTDATYKITIDNINDYMDYSLVESDDTVPSEAIRIAEILDVDNDFIGLAKSKLNAK